ncbi:MAG: electron transfer flavoprotein subunit alpha/FixB family protein [Chloroflexi bacterium]|nr:electron transfer flavoprotein subunit alpha/FixB family protein [Chloroflexota bacterium]MBI4198361.1 electron transfer flavoprotein subunit alpha/FixB family protein [Chloroflexota bacterium]
MADAKGVLVIGEAAGGQLDASAKELLAHGRKLADSLGEPLSIAILGDNLGGAPKEAIAFGADRVYAVSDPVLKEPQPEAYLAALTALAKEQSPKVIVAAKTPLGVNVGPRLAFRLETGLAQDCLEVKIDGNKKLVANRPVFGGNCMVSVACDSLPMMAVIRLKTAEPLPRNDSRSGEIVPVNPRLDPSVVKAKVIKRVEEKQEGKRLEDAEVIVSGGRGLGGPEPFQKELKELADLLGGVVSSSRAAVDIGWVPYSYQVGLTGKSVAPNLYIAVGISGASQHMAGLSGAKNIVAINKDANANIFKESRFGVVGEWQKVVPALIQAIRELK